MLVRINAEPAATSEPRLSIESTGWCGDTPAMNGTSTA
jgi:hypothetical protein